MRVAIRFFRLVPLVALVASSSCSEDGTTVLEDACRVVVDECGVGDSMGACIDALGSQLDECLICISESDCDYGTRCDAETSRCDLPGSYVQ